MGRGNPRHRKARVKWKNKRANHGRKPCKGRKHQFKTYEDIKDKM